MTALVSVPEKARKLDVHKAWKKLASPAWESLPEDFRLLFWRTVDAVKEVEPEGTLFRWPPKLRDLRREFDRFQPPVLGLYTRISYCYGDWSHAMWRVALKDPPKGMDSKPREFRWKAQAEKYAAHDRAQDGAAPQLVLYGMNNASGGFWKFSDLADQVLAQQLGLQTPRPMERDAGWWFELWRGFLRICLAVPGRPLLRVEAGPPPLKEAFWDLQERLPALPKGREPDWLEWNDLAEQFLQEEVAKLRSRCPSASEWLDADRVYAAG